MTQATPESGNLEQKTKKVNWKFGLGLGLGAIGLAAISLLAGFYIRGGVDELSEFRKIREKDNSIVSYKKINGAGTLYNYKDGGSMFVTNTGVFIHEKNGRTSYHAHHDRGEEKFDCFMGDGLSGVNIRVVKMYGSEGIRVWGYGRYNFLDHSFDLKDESYKEIIKLPELERVLVTFAKEKIQPCREKVDRLKSQNQ